MSGKDFIKNILHEDFFEASFDVNGEHYTFSGWWLLEWEYGDCVYETRAEFIKDPIFDGKTIAEVDIEHPVFEMLR